MRRDALSPFYQLLSNLLGQFKGLMAEASGGPRDSDGPGQGPPLAGPPPASYASNGIRVARPAGHVRRPGADRWCVA